MKGHPGVEGAVERMYKAQCAKDDAMAEGIADYLRCQSAPPATGDSLQRQLSQRLWIRHGKPPRDRR